MNPIGRRSSSGRGLSSDRQRRRVITGVVTLVAILTIWSAGAPPALAHLEPGYVQDGNWSGYQSEARGMSFDQVSANWRENSTHCQAGFSDFYTWIGLGDPPGATESGTRLQQIGTTPTCGRHGVAKHQFWEDVPEPAHPIDLPVHFGDQIHASVTITGHVVTLELQDLTKHWTFHKRLRTTSVDERAAEWIYEDKVVNSVGSPLAADFSPVTFADAHARTTAGASGAIDAEPWAALMIDLIGGNPQVLGALPGPLSASGTSFQIHYSDAVPPEEPEPPV